MKLFCIIAALFLWLSSVSAEDKSGYPALFEKAGAEFDVPPDVLRGIAFAETRWSHLRWAEGDTASPLGMPRPFGIMSLWDNDYFGHSLLRAADLICEDPAKLKTDPRQNVRGAAAYLSQLYKQLPLPPSTAAKDIESWANAIAAYCGIPQPELARKHVLDIYAHMRVGYHKHGIEWDARNVNLEPAREELRRARAEQQTYTKKIAAMAPALAAEAVNGTPDYPDAIWRPAYPGHWYATGNTHAFVVIHDMEGYYLSTISYFQQADTQTSIYYCVNGRSDYASDSAPGEITQMVEERFWAWHARCWNTYMFGIEHEGFVDNPAWYTEEMYQASGKLTQYLCNKYNIPKDRNHIIAHGEWQNAAWRNWMTANWPEIDTGCNTHTDPGPNWDWDHYMAIVAGDVTAAPQITYHPQTRTNASGTIATFTVTATGNNLSYRWRRNGTNLSSGGTVSGANSSTLTLANVQLADAAFYSVLVTNATGSVMSEPAQLVILGIPSALGTGLGLRGLFYDNIDFTSLKRARIDSAINFDWSTNSPSSTMDPETFSVRWLGRVEPRYSQLYTFYARADDGVRLWIDGSLLIDKWIDQAATEWRGTINLSAGQKYDLRMDYYEKTGAAAVELRWSSASQVKEIIPQTQLYRPAPVLGVISNQTINSGAILSLSLTVSNFDRYISSEPITDFEEFANGTPNDAVMFRKPSFSGSTIQFVDLTVTNYTSVTGTFPAGNSSARALKAAWTFSAMANNPWLRLTTASAASLPNPAIDFTRALWFDIYADRPVQVGLGARETGTTAAIGADGGGTGPIEWVGVASILNGTPVPIHSIPAGAWQTVQVMLPSEPVRPFTGDGMLQTTNNKGTLEHLAFTPGAGLGAYNIYLDNFVLVQNNELSFSLGPNAPAGASIDLNAGLFTWAVPASQPPGSFNITVNVTDGGTPPLTDTRTFAIQVQKLQIQNIRVAGNLVTMTWNSIARKSYSIQYKEDLNSTWRELSTLIATQAQSSYSEVRASSQGFYRVQLIE